jgi:alpha-beta hydrolase superfamily lysophospholipase
MAARFMRTGGYSPSEEHVEIIAANYANTMAGRALIYCHGAGINNVIDGADARADLERYADRGYVVCAPLLAGASSWGNAASVSAVDAVLTYLGTTYGADVTRPLFIADSHGASIVMNWAVRNPTRFGGATLRVPAISLRTMHDTNAGWGRRRDGDRRTRTTPASWPRTRPATRATRCS